MQATIIRRAMSTKDATKKYDVFNEISGAYYPEDTNYTNIEKIDLRLYEVQRIQEAHHRDIRSMKYMMFALVGCVCSYMGFRLGTGQ